MRRSNKKIHTSSASGTRYAIGCMYNIFFHKTLFHIIFIFWQCLFNNFLEHIKLLIHHFTLPGENTLNHKYNIIIQHDDAIKWKHFPRNWLFVLGIHRSPVNSPHKGQWRGALIFFYLSRNKRFGKQSSGWWFETLSRPSWRYCNEYQYCKYRTTIRHICQTVTVVDQSHQPYKAPVRHPTMLRAEQKCAQLHSERCTAGRTPVITGGTKSPPLQWNACVLYGLIPNPPQLYLCAFPIWFRRLFEWGACQLIKKKTHYSSQYNRSLLDVYIIR